VEQVFRALASPHRRALLDALYERPGRTLGELCALLDMTRQAVAKHLALLEQAELIVTRREGREKLHYLNPVPLRRIHDRWLRKFDAETSDVLLRLKREVERLNREDSDA
jgi:DNA-binding transcriptional ArsR family regulator